MWPIGLTFMGRVNYPMDRPGPKEKYEPSYWKHASSLPKFKFRYDATTVPTKQKGCSIIVLLNSERTPSKILDMAVRFLQSHGRVAFFVLSRR